MSAEEPWLDAPTEPPPLPAPRPVAPIPAQRTVAPVVARIVPAQPIGRPPAPAYAAPQPQPAQQQPQFVGSEPWCDDDEAIPPREWLLGNTFCKWFLSGLTGRGGSGKTALRIAQAMSVAIGRPLTGEKVFRQANVLFVSFEDHRSELKRRIRACRLHHKISAQELRGKMFVWNASGKIVVFDAITAKGPALGPLEEELKQFIRKNNIELVLLDPFVKTHSVNENDNNQIDFVVSALADIGFNTNGCAIDCLHHENKAGREDGQDRSRGASAFIDGGRLMYSLAPMSEDDAKHFEITPNDRRFLVRYERAKVNIGPPDESTMWFRLVGVELHNGSGFYTAGDTVQTVERWQQPDMFAGLSTELLNRVLDAIEAGTQDGFRWSPASQSTRSGSSVVASITGLSDERCKMIIKEWLKSGLLFIRDADAPNRKQAASLFVDQSKRPGTSFR